MPYLVDPNFSAFFVYRIFNADTDELLYIGSSRDPRVRFSHHRRKHWWPARFYATYEVYRSASDASQAEAEAIRLAQPRHNWLHRGPAKWASR